MTFPFQQIRTIRGTLSLRSLLSSFMVLWMLTVSTGISTGGWPSSIQNCRCDLQSRRSQNCCCFPGKSDRHLSCCSQKSGEKNTSQKPRERKTSEEDGPPQYNSSCGVPIENGLLIDREPRTTGHGFTPSLVASQTEILNFDSDLLPRVFASIELPPPEFSFA